MMPVDSIESYDGSVALLEQLDAQLELELELEASALLGSSESSIEVDPFHTIDVEILARMFETSAAISAPSAISEAHDVSSAHPSGEQLVDFLITQSDSPADGSVDLRVDFIEFDANQEVTRESDLQAQDHVTANIVLLDSQLEFSEALEASVASGAMLFLYDGTEESASQVLSRVEDWILATDVQIASLSILSHGAAGGFELGNNWITDETVGDYFSEFQSLATYFDEDASIYILGCNVVSDSQGQLLLDRLAEATGASVFASNDVTGVGGDWELESHSFNAISESDQELESILDLDSLKSTEVTLAWYNTNWNYRQTIIIDDAMVSGTSDLSNFTVLVNVTRDSLKLFSGGGRVGQADGGDFVFTLADGTTKLNHQIESYNSVTGNLVAWVKLPTLTYSVDTSLFVYYGNATVANQWNIAGTWASDVRASYHLAADFRDSTVNANNATNSGTTAVVNAKIAGGDLFNGVSNKLSAADSNSLDITGNLTVSGWFNSSNLSGYKALVAKGTGSTAVNYYIATKGTELEFEFYASGGLRTYTTVGAGLTTGSWYNFALTYDDAANAVKFYLNGDQIYSATTPYSLVANTGVLNIGTSPWNEWFNGSIDEVKIEASTKSASWIQTQFRNQNSPSFVTLSNEQGPPVITSGSHVSLLEGINSVMTVTASDPRLTNPSYSFTIAGGPDAARFVINSTTGALSFATAPVYLAPTDVGADNIYNVIVQVSTGTLTGAQSITVSVNSANDAPTIDAGAVFDFETISEDSLGPSGVLVSTILTSANYADVDTGALSGMAVTSLTGAGTWQYSTDGVSWTKFGAVSNSSALLLNSNTQIRFVPDGSNGEAASFSYRAWDRIIGTASSNGLPQKANITVTGGTSTFSSSIATAAITVTDLNDAPIIIDGYSGTLPSVMANTISTSTTISQILAASSYSELDHGAISGMAVTAVSGLGTWQYSTDGLNWQSILDVSNDHALLLDSTSQIRYRAPNNTSETATFSYRAWDQTLGAASTVLIAEYADSTTNGLLSSFSKEVATAELPVLYFNEAPIAQADVASALEAGGVLNQMVGENPSGNVLSNDSDTNLGDQLTVIGVSSGIVPSAVGSVGTSIQGLYGALVLQANGDYAYVLENRNSKVDGLKGSSDTLTDTFSYTIHDLSGATCTTQLVITIVGANDAPNALDGVLVVNENANIDSLVGVVNAVDVDRGELLSYSLIENAGGRFAIDAASGAITVANGLLLDYEAQAEHFVMVRATDQGGLVFDRTLSVEIVDLNEAPTAVPDLAFAVEAGGQANSLAGVDPIGNVLNNDFDQDHGDSKSVVGVAAGIHGFVSGSVNELVEGMYGTLTLETNGSYSYQVDNANADVQGLRLDRDQLQDVFTYSIADAAGAISTSQITVTIQGANDGPTLLNITSVTIDENSPYDFVIASVAASDADQDDSLHFSLTESGNGAFAIDNTGQIVVNDSSLLNRELIASYSLTVRVTDLAGDWVEQIVQVNLNDVDEFDVGTISDLSSAANHVAENAPSGTTVGIVAFAEDLDVTQNAIFYTLEDSAEGRFAIDSSTGTVFVADASGLDFESSTSHTILVRATSLDGSSRLQSFTIELLDVHDTVDPPISDGSINLLSPPSSPGIVEVHSELEASATNTSKVNDQEEGQGNQKGNGQVVSNGESTSPSSVEDLNPSVIQAAYYPGSLDNQSSFAISDDSSLLDDLEVKRRVNRHDRLYVGFLECENLSSLKNFTQILFGRPTVHDGDTESNSIYGFEHSQKSAKDKFQHLSNYTAEDFVPMAVGTVLIVWAAYLGNLSLSVLFTASSGLIAMPTKVSEDDDKDNKPSNNLRRRDERH